MSRFSGMYDLFLREVHPRALMRHWNGIPIHVIPDTAKVQVSEEFKRLQSPELVKETNAWLLEFFGVTNWLKDGQVIKTGDLAHPELGMLCFAVNPRTYEQLKSRDSAVIFPK